jgi:hypothetical protein
LGDPLKGNLLLFYKPLHLEAQQVSTRIEACIDISHFPFFLFPSSFSHAWILFPLGCIAFPPDLPALAIDYLHASFPFDVDMPPKSMKLMSGAKKAAALLNL